MIYSLPDNVSIFTIPSIRFCPDYDVRNVSTSSMMTATNEIIDHHVVDLEQSQPVANPPPHHRGHYHHHHHPHGHHHHQLNISTSTEPGGCHTAFSDEQPQDILSHHARNTKNPKAKPRNPLYQNRFTKQNSKSTFSIVRTVSSTTAANTNSTRNRGFLRSFSVSNLAYLLRFGRFKSQESFNSTDETLFSLGCADSGLGTDSGSNETKFSKPDTKLTKSYSGSNEFSVNSGDDSADMNAKYCSSQCSDGKTKVPTNAKSKSSLNGFKLFKESLSARSKSVTNIRHLSASQSFEYSSDYPPIMSSLTTSTVNCHQTGDNHQHGATMVPSHISANSCSSISLNHHTSHNESKVGKNSLSKSGKRNCKSTNYLSNGRQHYELTHANCVPPHPHPQLSFSYLSSL